MTVIALWATPSFAVSPVVNNGTIDLSQISHETPVRLDGVWRYYPSRLLTPTDILFSKLPEPILVSPNTDARFFLQQILRQTKESLINQYP